MSGRRLRGFCVALTLGWSAASAQDASLGAPAAAPAVATLQSLKALTQRPAVLLLAGREAAGDGGGGPFYWVPDDTTPADDAMVVQPQRGPAGRYRRQHDGTLQAGWFGYRPDGEADNAPALSACVAAAVAIAGQCRLPPGRARVGKTVTIAGTMTLKGAGLGTVIVPAGNDVGTVLEVTGGHAAVEGLQVDGTALPSPTYTAIRIDSPGLVRLRGLYLRAAGTGLEVRGCNACEFGELRIQDCPVGVRTGGVAGSYPGDIRWDQVVLIPLPDGVGWIVDGNTNAQYANRIQTIGGAIGLDVRGAGSATAAPDGLFFTAGNFTAASHANVRLSRALNVWFTGGTSIGGATAGDGLLIDGTTSTDVDGVFVRNAQVRGNHGAGIAFRSGANLVVSDSEVYGNSNGAGWGTRSNIEVGARAVGLFSAVDVMAGLSAEHERLANVRGPAKYAIELAAGALADVPGFPGRLVIEGGVQDGNAVGGVSDRSAPPPLRKSLRLTGASAQAFRAHADDRQIVPPARWTKVALPGVSLEGGGSFRDGRWRPLAGVYRLQATVALAEGSEALLAIYKNGAVHARARVVGGGALFDIVQADGSDVFEMYLYAPRGAKIEPGGHATFFAGG